MGAAATQTLDWQAFRQKCRSYLATSHFKEGGSDGGQELEPSVKECGFLKVPLLKNKAIKADNDRFFSLNFEDKETSRHMILFFCWFH